jgi:ribonuclease HII
MTRPPPDLSRERLLAGPVCGIDEAGRGPWAGPVAAAAVILRPGAIIVGLDDSKRLTPARRAALCVEIKARALCWSIGWAEVEEIDRVNILQATGRAMARAVAGLSTAPAHALIDGHWTPRALGCPATALVGGDGLSASIAAASILAKEARDAIMIALEDAHPGYGFARHKGYGVPEHAAALSALGPCAAHRMSFRPVAACRPAVA